MFPSKATQFLFHRRCKCRSASVSSNTFISSLMIDILIWFIFYNPLLWLMPWCRYHLHFCKLFSRYIYYNIIFILTIEAVQVLCSYNMQLNISICRFYFIFFVTVSVYLLMIWELLVNWCPLDKFLVFRRARRKRRSRIVLLLRGLLLLSFDRLGLHPEEEQMNPDF